MRRGRVSDLTGNRRGYQCQNSATHLFGSKTYKRHWGFPHGGESDFNSHPPDDDPGRSGIAAFDGFRQRRFRGTGLPRTQAGVIGARSAENSDSVVIKTSKAVLYPIEQLDAWDQEIMVMCRASKSSRVNEREGT
ncbi:MAG: hypothetical protein WBD78_03290 [Methylocella sp.]